MIKLKRAFGLVEIVVSLVVITAIAICSLQFLKYCSSLIVRNDLRLAALNFARETMEKQYMNSLSVTTSAVSDPLPTTGSASVLFTKHGGQRSYTVSASSSGAPYNVVKTTVTWND